MFEFKDAIKGGGGGGGGGGWHTCPMLLEVFFFPFYRAQKLLY